MAIIKYQIESLLDDVDPESYIQEISGEVFIYSETGERRFKAGKIRAFRLNLTYALNNRLHWFDIFDCHSNNIYRYYEALIDGEANDYRDSLWDDHREPCDTDLLIIDRIEILPKYRGQQLGYFVVKDLVVNFGLTCGYVVLEPYPLQFDAEYLNDEKQYLRMDMAFLDRNLERGKTRLAKYYQKIGFRMVKGTDFMLLNPAYDFDKLRQVKDCD